MARTRRRFTADYRVEAAHRVIDSGRTIIEVARDLGVGEQLLGRWVRDERTRLAAAEEPDVPDLPLTETERAELGRLRRKVVDQERKFEEQDDRRRHSSIGQVSPINFEQTATKLATAA